MLNLEPRSVALIGASSEAGKLGHEILKNLLTQGYKGDVFPINPKHPDVLGKKAYKSIGGVPKDVEMAVIVTPATTVLELAKECGKKKVQTLVVISAGFGEMHEQEGKDREAELKEICEEHQMTLIGPNCLGIIRPSLGLNASFAIDVPPKGNIALLSQSGALAVGIMDQAKHLHMGYSLVVSMGNKALTDEADFLEWCEEDEKTDVIGLYLESIKDGPRFRAVAERVAKKKRIVLIKAGTSEQGRMAVSSHTGALAGSVATVKALCIQTGIHLAESSREFLDLLRVLSTQPTLLTRNIAIITNAGGPGVLATDATEKCELHLAELSPKQKTALAKKLPPMASVGNPIDVLGDALEDRYKEALSTCGEDKNIDGVVVLLTPQIMTPCEAIAKEIIAMKKKYPLMPVTVSFIGNDSVKSAIEILEKSGIPVFETPEAAVCAMGFLKENAIKDRMTVENPRADDRTSGAEEILHNQSGLLPVQLVEELFGLYELPLPEARLAVTKKDAVEYSDEIGYPVIAKISSPDILHKTDIGGVRARLKNKKEVEQAFDEIMQNVSKHLPSAGIDGILIQEMLPPGHEFIVGGLREPNSDPLILVGLGGIYTELMRDTAFRLAPFSIEDAYAMLEELKSWKLLLGLRGEGQLDVDALAALIVSVGTMMTECPTIKELDINPVLVRTDSISIADAKVVVEPKPKKFISR